ncbi:MAG TPA: L-ribulose-5-phosphate 4-epimerase [Pirellulaceae bacterium]|nr:L-ribulose-5-phosphate 4-epimerase [Pirellulaceae bacterium]
MSHLHALREAVCAVNRGLPAAGLVTMHSGNASGIDRRAGRLVIKPSGIDYATLTPEMLVEVDLKSGEVIDSTLRPSVDLPHHLYIYRRDPSIGGVIHTHSNYATAFAACHESIPLVLTAIADEFGGEIPCCPFAECDGDELGRLIFEHRTSAPAALLANHGVFTWGKDVHAAFKAAVMTEDVAKTVFLARQLGQPRAIPMASARKYYERYHTRYGQKAA